MMTHLLIQVVSTLFVFGFNQLLGNPITYPYPFIVIGVVCAVIATIKKMPIWWRFIHAFFVPLAWLVSQQNISSTWFLVGFVVLYLIFRGAVSEQVPLYFSNTKTVYELIRIAEERKVKTFLDIGAGVGTTLLPLANNFPKSVFVGVENAPLTWLIGKFRMKFMNNVQWKMQDLWKTDLSEFDMVYAFLSPAPMVEIWEKAKSEMKPGSMLISNTFQIPNVEPNRIIEIDCMPSRVLYCYEIN